MLVDISLPPLENWGPASGVDGWQTHSGPERHPKDSIAAKDDTPTRPKVELKAVGALSGTFPLPGGGPGATLSSLYLSFLLQWVC